MVPFVLKVILKLGSRGAQVIGAVEVIDELPRCLSWKESRSPLGF